MWQRPHTPPSSWLWRRWRRRDISQLKSRLWKHVKADAEARGKVLSQEANKLQMSFLANSIYSRDPISKMSINCRSPFWPIQFIVENQFQRRQTGPWCRHRPEYKNSWGRIEACASIVHPCNSTGSCRPCPHRGTAQYSVQGSVHYLCGSNNGLCFISHYNKGFRTFSQSSMNANLQVDTNF